MSKYDLSIIIAAYNEERSIKLSLSKLIKALKKSKILFELIIINDGSSDNTLFYVKEFYKLNNTYKIHIIDNVKNLGKSSCLHKGINIANSKFITVHDADLEYDPNDLIRMYNMMINKKKLDAVYGSRYLNTKLKTNQRFLYYLANKMNLFIFNFLFKTKLTDLHSCYKLFKSDIIKNIDFVEKKFGFELEVSANLIKKIHIISEIPIFYNARSKKLGKKISFIDEIFFLLSILKFRFII